MTKPLSRQAWRLLGVLVLTAATGPAGARDRAPLDCADDCRAGLAALIAAGSIPLSASSPCGNVIRGHCTAGRHCALQLLHRFGEDVSSLELGFTLRGGRADIATLECVMTP